MPKEKILYSLIAPQGKILYSLKAPTQVKVGLQLTRLMEFPEIVIGYRPCWNLVELAKQEKVSLRVPSDGSFYLIELFSSFSPTRKEKIDKATLEVIVEEPSIVYDMTPRKLEEAIEHENEFGVSAELGIGPAKVGPKYVRKWKSKSVVPNLYTYGIGTSKARWTFSRGRGNTLYGTQDLALIIMTPKQSSASIALELDAISVKNYGWGTQNLPRDKKQISVGPHCASKLA